MREPRSEFAATILMDEGAQRFVSRPRIPRRRESSAFGLVLVLVTFAVIGVLLGLAF